MNETQQKIYTQAKGKWDAIAKPIDSLGVFEDMVARLCAIAGTMNPGDYKRRALLTLCADHGVVAEGVTQTDASVTKVVAENIAHGCSGLSYVPYRMSHPDMLLPAYRYRRHTHPRLPSAPYN